MRTTRKRIAVGLSGGTDSSVAAWMLGREGHDVVGLTLRLWPGSSDRSGGGHLANAAAVCEKLGIAHHTATLYETFEAAIVTPFVDAYAAGLTPSPCVLCNPVIKFGVMLEEARRLGCDALATGHYARIEQVDDGRYRLRRGVDETKEQSYFLNRLSQAQLEHTRFPLGESRKTDIADIALREGLIPEAHGESQDLCFVPDGDYASFVCRRRPDLGVRGAILDTGGKHLGEHEGFFRYTIGQRKGLGLGGGPWYVVDVDPERNVIVVDHGEKVCGSSAWVEGLNWIDPAPAEGDALGITAQLRYNMRPVEATVRMSGPDQALIELHTPVSAITPGQAAVFYAGEYVVGGGWICRPPDGKTSV